MLNRNISLFICFVSALLGIGYLWFNSDLNLSMTAQKKKGAAQEAADTYLISTKITQYDHSGALDYQLISTAVTHYPFNDTTLLQTPEFKSYQNPKKTLLARADNGKLLPGGQDLELWDNVVMIQAAPHDGSEIQMNTDFITIYSNRRFASTDRPVLMRSKTGETRAIGMDVDYKQSLVKFKSRVRGSHQPDK